MSEVRSNSPSEGTADLFSLTQIRHLMRVEFGRAQRYGYPVTCLMIEVDRLGYLRDLYGYEMKENVLEDVIELLQAQTRSCDFLGRQMDDRLMAVLPHTPADGGTVAAERLLSAARALSFEGDGRDLHITLSVGQAHYENDNTLFFDELVDAAEAALNQASGAGGDRLVARHIGLVDG